MSVDSNYIYISHGWSSSLFSVSSSSEFWSKRRTFRVLSHLSFCSHAFSHSTPSPRISFPLFLQNNSDSTFNPEFRHHCVWKALPGSTLPVKLCSLLSLHTLHCSRKNCSLVLTSFPKSVFLLLEGQVPTVFIIVLSLSDTQWVIQNCELNNR